MKKAIETKYLSNAIYPYEQFIAISDRAYWGENLNDIKAIDGATAMAQAAKDNVPITGILQEGVLYVFRWTQKGDKLVPCHVSMKPKTAANLEKGSARYGSGTIIAELR